MKTISCIIFLLISNSAFAGSETRNGGQGVRCSGSENIYSLDYLRAKQEFQFSVEVPLNLEISLYRILHNLENKAPQVARSFKNFLSGFSHNKSFNDNHVWFENNNLDDVSDQSTNSVPLACRAGDGGSVAIFQVIVREHFKGDNKMNSQVRFLLDSEIFNQMDSLQQSFLLVHEWLWEFTQDYARNWRINYLLHSSAFDTISKEDFKIKAKEIGVNFNEFK